MDCRKFHEPVGAKISSPDHKILPNIKASFTTTTTTTTITTTTTTNDLMYKKLLMRDYFFVHLIRYPSKLPNFVWVLSFQFWFTKCQVPGSFPRRNKKNLK